jgi:hypothetical protein
MSRLEVLRAPARETRGPSRLDRKTGSRRRSRRPPGCAYTARVMGETRRILERGIARGQVRPDTDLAATATVIAAPLVYRMLAEQQAPDAHLVDAVVELVARAVCAEPR